MPHHQSLLEADWESLCKSTPLHFINPRREVEQVLLEIQQTELLLTEAMHGAIVADALRVPWIPVRLYGNFLDFKWQDWSQSLGLRLSISDVPPIYQRKGLGPRHLVQTSKKVLATAGLGKAKWNYLRTKASTNTDVQQSLRALEQVAKEQEPCLSNESRLNALQNSLNEKLEVLRQDWIRGEFRQF